MIGLERPLACAPCAVRMLRSPFWTGATHVVQLRPIRIEQRGREPAPSPSRRAEDPPRTRARERARRAYCSENILGHDLEIDVTDASLAILLRQEARAAAMNADSIQYALETDWRDGAAGFGPPHSGIEIRQDSSLGRQDSNPYISESDPLVSVIA
jgi:hypothetical protein